MAFKLLNNEVQTLDKQQFIQQLLSLEDDSNNEGSHPQEIVESLMSVLKDNAESFAIAIKKDSSLSLEQYISAQVTEQSVTGFTQLNKLFHIIDELFNYLVIKSGLDQIITSAINCLRLPYLMLSLADSDALVKTQHPARQLINDLVKAGLMWDPKDLKTEQIKQQITNTCEQILLIAGKQTTLGPVITTAAEQFGQFYNGLVKRAEIFEKRMREAEEGQAKAATAKILAKRRLRQIINKEGTPEFVLQMLNNAWQHLLFLDYLKNQNQEKCESLFDAKCLLVSLQPVEGIHGIEKFLELQPMLIEKLKSGLEKTTYSFTETSLFLEQLDAIHNDLLMTAKSSIEKAPKEEILRLKPTLNFGLEEETSQPQISKRPSLESLSLVEWVNHVFESLPSKSTESEPDEQHLGRQQKEKNAIQELVKLLKPGRWVSLQKDDQSVRCKLSTYIESSDKYIFVGSSGNKVAEFDSDSLSEAYKNNTIKILENSPLFEQAVKSVFNELFDKYQQQLSPQTVTSEKDIESDQLEPAQTFNFSDKKEEAKTTKIEAENTTVNLVDAEASDTLSEDEIDNLSHLAVGSWLEIQVGYKMKKCRLAAKIASTGKFLFTDRSGIKVKECFDKELPDLYRAGKVKLDKQNTFFDKALASVITNMRNLKSEKS